ncbi:hypothetical protein [Nocardia sp. CA-290969]|uniref:hypothetical protein n=1 Tax=Nocardia sp. CA-290969 TaxID=3239986 RepID=UPI003D8B460E
MSPNSYPGPAQLRGCVVGGATGALAVAAHGAAGGGYPTSTGAALLLLTALVTGWASGSVVPGMRSALTHRAAATGAGIFGPLAAGQFAGHWALTGLTGHHTGADTAIGESLSGGPLSTAMFAAHLLAVLLCTLMIAAAERLYRAASAVVRALLTPMRDIPRALLAVAAAPAAAPRYRAPNGASGPRAPPAPAHLDASHTFGEKVFDPCPTGFHRPCAVV